MSASPAGLDDMQLLRRIAAGRRSDQPIAHLLDRIGAHLDAHDGFVAWSGGKDSTVVVDRARRVDPHIPVVFYDSGLQFPETLDYLRDCAAKWRLNFHVITAEPDLLSVLVAGGGFDHTAPDRVLRGPLSRLMITGPAAQAHARYGPGSLWGVRAEESPARRQLYRAALAQETRRHGTQLTGRQLRGELGGIVRRVEGSVTYGPIWDWQRTHVFDYLAGRGIEPNPLYGKLAALGVPAERIRVDSILDAAMLSNGHVAWLQKGWPALFDQLCAVLPRLREWT